MNAKLFTYTVVILLVVAAITVEGKKGKEKKSKKDSKKEKDGYTPMMRCFQKDEAENGTQSEFSRKAQQAMADCMTSMGFSANDTNNFGNETTSKKQRKAKEKAKKKADKEIKKQRMCLMACSWKKLEILSGDGTEFNRTAIEAAVEDMMIPEVQKNYMEAMDKCMDNKKLSLVNIELGEKCKKIKPYVACMERAADKACPRPESTTEKLLEKDDDTNDSNSNSSSSESNEDN